MLNTARRMRTKAAHRLGKRPARRGRQPRVAVRGSSQDRGRWRRSAGANGATSTRRRWAMRRPPRRPRPSLPQVADGAHRRRRRTSGAALPCGAELLARSSSDRPPLAPHRRCTRRWLLALSPTRPDLPTSGCAPGGPGAVQMMCTSAAFYEAHLQARCIRARRRPRLLTRGDRSCCSQCYGTRHRSVGQRGRVPGDLAFRFEPPRPWTSTCTRGTGSLQAPRARVRRAQAARPALQARRRRRARAEEHADGADALILNDGQAGGGSERRPRARRAPSDAAGGPARTRSREISAMAVCLEDPCRPHRRPGASVLPRIGRQVQRRDGGASRGRDAADAFVAPRRRARRTRAAGHHLEPLRRDRGRGRGSAASWPTCSRSCRTSRWGRVARLRSAPCALMRASSRWSTSSATVHRSAEARQWRDVAYCLSPCPCRTRPCAGSRRASRHAPSCAPRRALALPVTPARGRRGRSRTATNSTTTACTPRSRRSWRRRASSASEAPSGRQLRPSTLLPHLRSLACSARPLLIAVRVARGRIGLSADGRRCPRRGGPIGRCAAGEADLRPRRRPRPRRRWASGPRRPGGSRRRVGKTRRAAAGTRMAAAVLPRGAARRATRAATMTMTARTTCSCPRTTRKRPTARIRPWPQLRHRRRQAAARGAGRTRATRATRALSFRARASARHSLAAACGSAARAGPPCGLRRRPEPGTCESCEPSSPRRQAGSALEPSAMTSHHRSGVCNSSPCASSSPRAPTQPLHLLLAARARTPRGSSSRPASRSRAHMAGRQEYERGAAR